MARLFVVDQSEACTSRIVGTYGYMSPEYAMHGHFSVKSDVFSFGVLVLEIISGQKNNSFYQSERADEDLLCYAWRQWQEGNGLELLEPVLREHFSRIPSAPPFSSQTTTKKFEMQLEDETVSDSSQAILKDHSASTSIPDSVNEVSISELDPR
ncbi:Cysteine-rich receptor-like protein kinase [Thalictrum thalictroides]|uniref:Cysteine-rich receptor-like protein kinase n=1 Tax=Thalictrum thalictroides TaxID=46969 RepID=A0A7J6VV25_THATH|nr:Cysteine-rich receptor-like protein kinase [Thalictrum thalictroides]